MSILFSSQTPFTLENMVRDDEGRFLYLKGRLSDSRFSFAMVYCPNVGHAALIQKLCNDLCGFVSGTLVLGHDFNVPLSPTLDYSTGATSIPYKALKRMKTDLLDLTLHDAWRTLHPSVKDYTFYSSPHNKYSKIDYLFLSQADLPKLHSSTIEPMTFPYSA